MQLNRSVGIGILIVFVVAAVGYLAFRDTDDTSQTGDARQVYISSEFGFSFEYPAHAKLETYSPVAFALDANALGGFNAPDAEVLLIASGEDTYDSFDAFVTEQVTAMCAADGPSETVYCDAVADRTSFTAQSGLGGEMLSLNRVHEDMVSGDTDEETFGPVFVFNLSENLSELQYVALIVRPPLSDSPDQINRAFVQEIAETVQIERNEVAEVAELGLVTEVRVADAEASVTVNLVEWLEGDAARTAAAADTECTTANAEECAPSLANGFYVRSTNGSARTYQVASDASIVLLNGTQPVTSSIEDLRAKIDTREAPLLTAIEIENGTVIRIEEVYTP